MNIKILQLIEGAKQANGLTVIIDVFRAFTVECYLANNGAEKIMPVGDKEIAYKEKETNPNILLIGERKGKILPGFDYGNSPSQIKNIDFSCKELIHTTSSGTQGIANAVNADEILTGSLVNSMAIAKYILSKNPKDVSLVCMGLGGYKNSDEDTLCAEYIKYLLEHNLEDLDISKEIENLKQTNGSKFFDKNQQDVFPEEDFYLSTEKNKFNFILRLKKNTQGLDTMEKIDII